MKRNFYSLLFCIIPFLTSGQAVITAVFDADLPGGLPKGVELYVKQDIADLSLLGIGSANNGGGTDGVEFTFPVISIDSGSYLYLASDSASFTNFFGFNADYTTAAMAINGDDAIELFWDSTGIDVFGDINLSGTGQPWEYTDGWASRKAFTGPDGSTFVLQNWRFSGIGGLDGETTNGSAANPVPLKSYTDTTSTGPDVTVIAANLVFAPQDITIEVGQTVRWMNIENFEEHNVNGQQSIYPCNPTSFFSGEAALGPWEFDVTFNVAGFYEYRCDPHFDHGMIGSVTVVDPNAEDYPVYTIATVHSEDVSGNADSVGTVCDVRGVVHGPNFRPTGLQFTIIDVGAEVGINVFKNDADCYIVNEGDLISVKGEITQFNGLTELVVSGQPIDVLSSGNALMSPNETGSALDESMESTMVTVSDITVDSIVSTGASGWNLYGTNDEAVQYLVRLDGDVFTDVSGYDGEIIHVTGIVGQFDDEEPYSEGYQLQPRSIEDIEIEVSTINLPASAIKLSPNPTTDAIFLETDLLIERIRIFSAQGVLLSEIKSNSGAIDVSAFIAGMYLIVATTTDGNWSGKLIKN